MRERWKGEGKRREEMKGEWGKRRAPSGESGFCLRGNLTSAFISHRALAVCATFDISIRVVFAAPFVRNVLGLRVELRKQVCLH